MKKIFIFIFIIIFSFRCYSLEVTLTQGTIETTPIAITDLYAINSDISKIGKNISTVISNNLERSGLFIPIDKKAFIQNIESLKKQPRFEDWKLIKAQYLFSGTISINSDDKILVCFKLFDVLSQKSILPKKKICFNPVNKRAWRRISHYISDIVFEKITGEGGYFDTRIVYIAEIGTKENRQKRLAIMDQDQANHRFLTDGSYLVLTPRFSPNSQKITYMSYANPSSPRVFIFDIETGQQEIVGEFPGMTFAPRFSPLGDEVIMTLADKGNSDIYTLNLKTNISKQLTKYPGIDTSPSFSPNSKQIVFNSDRGGSPQLYVMTRNGKNIKRINYNYLIL